MQFKRSTINNVEGSKTMEQQPKIEKGILRCGLVVAIFFVLFVFGKMSYAKEPEKIDQVFKARVIGVMEQVKTDLPDGGSTEQQKIKLKGLEGEMNGVEFIFNGIGAYDVVGKNLYQKGDTVLAVKSVDDKGNKNFYITDFVRTNALVYLLTLFLLVILSIGRMKGFRSLLSLSFSFLMIVKFIIPQILNGTNPILVTIFGSLSILLVMVYLTEGFKKSSHIAIISIFLSLVLTVFISWLFVTLTKLSGVSSEEISFLAIIGKEAVDFKGLLIAGIIIGALGVLDDVVMSQIAIVEELLKIDAYQQKRTLFKRAYNVGITHISSMSNTLFLAYAGASLPLLFLFLSGNSAFSSFGQIVNNEAIATEIVRTLAGSIGLILSVPIATGLAVWLLPKKGI